MILILLLAKKPIADYYSALAEKIKTNPKSLKFKLGNRVRITKYKNIFSKGLPKISLEKYLQLMLCGKLIHGHIKLHILIKKKQEALRKRIAAYY